MPSRVLQFLRDSVSPWGSAPEPPPFIKDVPGGYALFMDENESAILYAKPWPYLGCPNDDRTNSTTWLIDGQRYAPSRRDEKGNWIFRRCVG